MSWSHCTLITNHLILIWCGYEYKSQLQSTETRYKLRVNFVDFYFILFFFQILTSLLFLFRQCDTIRCMGFLPRGQHKKFPIGIDLNTNYYFWFVYFYLFFFLLYLSSLCTATYLCTEECHNTFQLNESLNSILRFRILSIFMGAHNFACISFNKIPPNSVPNIVMCWANKWH